MFAAGADGTGSACHYRMKVILHFTFHTEASVNMTIGFQLSQQGSSEEMPTRPPETDIVLNKGRKGDCLCLLPSKQKLTNHPKRQWMCNSHRGTHGQAHCRLPNPASTLPGPCLCQTPTPNYANISDVGATFFQMITKLSTIRKMLIVLKGGQSSRGLLLHNVCLAHSLRQREFFFK